MGYFVFNALLLIYLLVDGYRRKVPRLWLWALGVLVVGVLVLPFYFAKRPLRSGEVRAGGTSWNVLKNFALLWTLLLAVMAVASMSGLGSLEPAESDAEAVGQAIGAGIGLGALACAWFVPMVGALIVGFFLKNDAAVEEGPTGPLAA